MSWKCVYKQNIFSITCGFVICWSPQVLSFEWQFIGHFCVWSSNISRMRYLNFPRRCPQRYFFGVYVFGLEPLSRGRPQTISSGLEPLSRGRTQATTRREGERTPSLTVHHRTFVFALKKKNWLYNIVDQHPRAQVRRLYQWTGRVFWHYSSLIMFNFSRDLFYLDDVRIA
jgi:hypothetical protein